MRGILKSGVPDGAFTNFAEIQCPHKAHGMRYKIPRPNSWRKSSGPQRVSSHGCSGFRTGIGSLSSTEMGLRWNTDLWWIRLNGSALHFWLRSVRLFCRYSPQFVVSLRQSNVFLFLLFGIDRTAYWITLGDLNIVSTNDIAHPRTICIAEKITHPNYDPRWQYHDIALFKLASKVTLDPWIRPACLMHVNRDDGLQVEKPTQRVIATGWGAVGEGTKFDYMYESPTTLTTNDRLNTFNLTKTERFGDEFQLWRSLTSIQESLSLIFRKLIANKVKSELDLFISTKCCSDPLNMDSPLFIYFR